MRKVYFDRTETKDCVGIIMSGAQVIPAGATVNVMSVKYKNEEYQRFADEYDIHFIFGDDVPALAFYTVPWVDVLARDSEGGLIATLGSRSDLESDAPMLYINKRQECFLIARTGKEFLEIAGAWKRHLEPYDDVVFYKTKAEAEKELEFVTIKGE